MIITLLSDFGALDAYAGIMKGVILSINPGARVVDLSHEVSPHDVVDGGWLLRTSYAYFPAGTVHLAVVDPGVGASRRAVAVRAHGHFFVGPDNGVLSYAVLEATDFRAVELTNAEYHLPRVSATFHGRDIFAPVAAHLSAGVPLDALGPVTGGLAPSPVPRPVITSDELAGEVIHVDRFGNLITNLDQDTFDVWRAGVLVTVQVAGQVIGTFVRTYADIPRREAAALIGSHGHLEVAAREASAAALLRAGRGALVRVHRAYAALGG